MKCDRNWRNCGKIESPVVEENSATGQKSNYDSTANNQVIDDLQNQVSSLEIRLKYSRKEKKGLEQQLADVERENNILTKDGTVLNRRLEQIRELERENQQLRTELQTPSASVQPDYE